MKTKLLILLIITIINSDLYPKINIYKNLFFKVVVPYIKKTDKMLDEYLFFYTSNKNKMLEIDKMRIIYLLASTQESNYRHMRKCLKNQLGLVKKKNSNNNSNSDKLNN